MNMQIIPGSHCLLEYLNHLKIQYLQIIYKYIKISKNLQY